MLGYAFMGKAHSSAFLNVGHIAWPPPLRPRLVAIAGRDEAAVADAAARYGYERWTTDWRDIVADPSIGLFDNGGPNSVHAEPTIAAAEAGKHVLCEKPLGRTADEAYEIWSRVAATGVKHLCGFNYRFVPAVRLARELIEAGELGEIRHFRARYLQDWAEDPSLDTWRFSAEDAGLGRDRRPRHARDRPEQVPGRRDRGALRGREDLRPRPQGRRRDRVRRRVRRRSRRHDRGDAARARPPQRLPVGDQRLEGLALVRHGAHERAAGLPRRRRPRARRQDGARHGGRPPVHGLLVAARATSSAGATRSRTRSCTCSRRSPTTATSAPYGATFEDGYRASEVCDAIVRSSAEGRRIALAYRSLCRRSRSAVLSGVAPAPCAGAPSRR